MRYKLQTTTQFKKDLKRVKKRGFVLNDLETIIELLLNGTPLPEKCHDHELVGNMVGFRECHIYPDWLLIYYIQQDRLILVCSRTGTHSDLF